MPVKKILPARLMLLSEASNNYWRIGFVNQQITTLQQSIDYAKETLRLVGFAIVQEISRRWM